MGVIYKTKNEVKEFIIKEKRANPNLSCRQVVPLIKKKFGISLSKSSINAIFKEANLSSPVGRKPRGKIKTPGLVQKTKAEAITAQLALPAGRPTLPPQEKLPLIKEKKGPAIIPPPPEPVVSEPIVLGMPPVTSEPSISKPEQEPISPPEKPSEEIIPPPPPQPESPPTKPVEEAPQKIEETVKPAESVASAEKLTPGVKEPSEKVAEKPPRIEEEKPAIMQPLEMKDDEIIDGLGCFFLKAAEWELSPESLFGGILQKYIIHIPPSELNLNSEILLFLDAFDLSSWRSFEEYDQKGLWLVNAAQTKINPQYLLNFAKDLKKLRGLPMAIFNEYYKNCPEIIYLKVFLEDRTVFYIDPRFHSLWQDINVPDSVFVTTYKAKDSLRKCFVENTQPIILQTAPGYNTFSAILSEFIWSCEAIPAKSMAKIALYNHKHQEVHTTDILPAEKRYFIVGFWPWQEEGMHFIREDLRRVKSFLLPEREKEIFYSENLVYFRQPFTHQKSAMRIGLIRNTSLGWPNLGIITNLPGEKPMEEIIALYVRRWPNAEEGYQYFTKKCSRLGHKPIVIPGVVATLGESGGLLEYTLSIPSSDLHANLNALLLALNNFCRQYFFPPAYEKADFTVMQEHFYSLGGNIKKQDHFLIITLHPPSNYPLKADLNFAICRFNESDIKTPAGEQIFMQID